MFVFKGIRTIKTDNWEENKKIIWFTTSSEADLKQVLSSFSIVVMSFVEHKEKLLWNFYEVSVFKDDVDVDIIFQVEWKIRDAFDYFDKTFWISNIKYIKPYWKEIPEDKLKLVLDKLLKEKKEKFSSLSKSKKWWTNKSGEKIITNQKKVDAFKKDVEDFITEMRDFLPEANKVDPTMALKLETLVWDLLKYKKTTNTFKIAGVYKEAIEIAENLYEKYFDYKKKEDVNNYKTNIISEFDIIKEYKNYQKVQRAKSLEKIDSKEFGFPWYEVLYYKIFWRFWINMKLILKEFLKKYELNYVKLDDIFNFIHFILIFLIIEYSIFLVYKVVLENASIADQLSVYYILLNISSLWFIFSIWKFIAKKSVFLSILIMILTYLLFSYLKYFFWL